MPSLVAGGLAGALLIAAGSLAVRIGTSPRVGLLIGLGVSAALASRFVMAYRKSKKVMPAGMMAVLSVVGILVTVSAPRRRDVSRARCPRAQASACDTSCVPIPRPR